LILAIYISLTITTHISWWMTNSDWETKKERGEDSWRLRAWLREREILPRLSPPCFAPLCARQATLLYADTSPPICLVRPQSKADKQVKRLPLFPAESAKKSKSYKWWYYKLSKYKYNIFFFLLVNALKLGKHLNMYTLFLLKKCMFLLYEFLSNNIPI
jgi:hypothetical protein